MIGLCVIVPGMGVCMSVYTQTTDVHAHRYRKVVSRTAEALAVSYEMALDSLPLPLVTPDSLPLQQAL